MKIGFIGVGTLSAAVVSAMARKFPNRTIYLSPRSDDKTTSLSSIHANVHRLDSNQAVIDASDMVMLGMLPPQAEEVLRELSFTEHHMVVSFVAGISAHDIGEMVSPAQRVCRVTPITTIELFAGPITMFPAFDEVIEAFKGLGEIISVPSEQDMKLLGCSSAILSTYFEFQNTVIRWATAQGVDNETASRYIRNLLSGLSTVGLSKATSELEALPGKHQTPGGLNERVRNGLLAAGWFDELSAQLDILNTKVNLTEHQSD